MLHRPSAARAVSLLLTISLLAASAVMPVATTAAPSTVRLVITVEPGTSPAQADRLATVSGARLVDRIDQLGVRVVELPAAAVANARSRWARMAEVLRVEADGLARIDWTPPDPLWGNQLEQRLVRAPKAWDLERGSRSTIVAVVDTGVQLKHPDLSARLVSGRDFVNHDRKPADDNGHGTAVAGVIAATANSIGVTGLCNRCRIMPVKALAANGTGFWTVAAKAIVWAADHGADVINMSFGGPTGLAALQDAIRYARARGAVVIGSAGNYGTTAPFYPGAYPEVMSVAASTSYDLRYDWSNSSTTWVEVAAPGCTWTSTRPSEYGGFCGTSAAAPMVSGIAAMVRSARPHIGPWQVEAILQATTVDVPFPFTRFGRIDAFKAVYRAVHGTIPGSKALKPSAPLLDPAPEVTLLAGNHAGYRFDTDGAIIRGTGLSTQATSYAHTSKRATIPTRGGFWYQIVDGDLAGFWVAESSRVFLTPAPAPAPTPLPTP
ncbi:MAG TPA: S8 family serine peptidase [Candidatus Limnocylindria bacterium]|nr:S8 family serine peptidase [Candidatus Limnocylindria bacterium]